MLRHVTRASTNLFPQDIYKSFDDGYEVRGVFLDVSKAFDKVRHHVLHFKIRQNGMSGKLLNTLTDFLDKRTKRVILNC